MDRRLLYLVFGVALLVIRDKNNRPVGYLEQRGDRTFVRDVNYELLGYTDKRGTFEGECLYDMTWYVLDKTKYVDKTKGMLIRQPMVLESEWEPDPTMDTDFQNLVQARADVRVCLFPAANAQEIDNYIARCRDQAQSFAGTQSSDLYVCAGFDWSKKTFARVQTFVV